MRTSHIVFIFLSLFSFAFIQTAMAQELYVMSEPASIMPTRSIMIKQSYQQMGERSSSTFYNTQLKSHKFHTVIPSAIQQWWLTLF